MLICPIADDGDSDHFLNVMLANLLYWSVTVFHLVIHKYPTERYFEIM